MHLYLRGVNKQPKKKVLKTMVGARENFENLTPEIAGKS